MMLVKKRSLSLRRSAASELKSSQYERPRFVQHIDATTAAKRPAKYLSQSTMSGIHIGNVVPLKERLTMAWIRANAKLLIANGPYAELMFENWRGSRSIHRTQGAAPF